MGETNGSRSAHGRHIDIHAPATPLRTGLRVFALGLLVGLVIVAASLVVLEPLTAGQHRAERVTRDDLSIQQRASALRMSLVQWQLFLEPQLDAYTNSGGKTTFSPVDIAKGSKITETQTAQSKSLSSALRRRGFVARAHSLDAATTAFTKAITGLTPVASGAQLTTAQFAAIVRDERHAYTHEWEVAAALNDEVTRTATTPDVAYFTERVVLARQIIVVVGGALLLLALTIGGLSARGAARRQRTRQLDAQRVHNRTELQQALELSTNEEAVYGVVGRALRETVPHLDVELLIADSSRAHFHRVLGSDPEPDNGNGCGVISPRDCPAATRGHTMEFASSDAISACPYLQGRPRGACSAVCIPVSIAGSTVGVMHATGANGVLPMSGDLENLELSARRSAERIALLRAFERSESQARTDPLTGLLNRRSLENQVRELQGSGIPYALAYGDLDHFKVLNDTHGHEAGDQALRLFSRVMRDSVRPADLVSRYGGEEFVVVLPDCSPETAIAVLERLRERLAITLTSGRVPAFTVSFGLASSRDAGTFDEVVAIADRALLDAKTAGRNRVILASALGRSSETVATA
jgi:diguanylate cyclase (GGDEF)-like protein